ncbi:hypothetical protein [Achromobacter insuavis]|uniref:hypothetical protein n=1 Tax=Achromobacter insuavis TaxID=1287735 RepID=UPI001EEF6D9A|nr:hypothetical protein [Achromobacter insuavis]
MNLSRIPYKVVITRTTTTTESVERTVYADSEDDAKVLGRYEEVHYWGTGASHEVVKVTSVQRESLPQIARPPLADMASRN